MPLELLYTPDFKKERKKIKTTGSSEYALAAHNIMIGLFPSLQHQLHSQQQNK